MITKIRETQKAKYCLSFVSYGRHGNRMRSVWEQGRRLLGQGLEMVKGKGEYGQSK